MVMADMATMDMDMARDLLNLLLLLSPDMDMVMGIILDMVDMDIMDTMARGLLMLSQLPLLSQLLLLNLQLLLSLDIFMAMDMAMDTILAMDMVDMDTMDTMARDLLRLSQDMDTMVMDMDMDTMDMAMDIMDTMARDLLMPSQDMDIMAMDMAMDMDMDMDMAMVMDTMVKQICCSFIEFSTNEVDQRDLVKRNTL